MDEGIHQVVEFPNKVEHLHLLLRLLTSSLQRVRLSPHKLAHLTKVLTGDQSGGSDSHPGVNFASVSIANSMSEQPSFPSSTPQIAEHKLNSESASESMLSPGSRKRKADGDSELVAVPTHSNGSLPLGSPTFGGIAGLKRTKESPQKRIEQFFAPAGGSPNSRRPSGTSATQVITASSPSPGVATGSMNNAPAPTVDRDVIRLDEDDDVFAAPQPPLPKPSASAAPNRTRQKSTAASAPLPHNDLSQSLDSICRQLSSVASMSPAVSEVLQQLRSVAESARAVTMPNYHDRYQQWLIEILKTNSENEFRKREIECHLDQQRLGQPVRSLVTNDSTERWALGDDVIQCSKQLEEIDRELSSIATQRKELGAKKSAHTRRKSRPLPSAAAASSSTPSSASAEIDDDFLAHCLEMDLYFEHRIKQLQQLQLDTQHRLKELDCKRSILSRTLRLLDDQRASKYATRPLLHHRYQLLNLLGKGGFSEVFKAFDVIDLRFVAIKVHRLQPEWSHVCLHLIFCVSFVVSLRGSPLLAPLTTGAKKIIPDSCTARTCHPSAAVTPKNRSMSRCL